MSSNLETVSPLTPMTKAPQATSPDQQADATPKGIPTNWAMMPLGQICDIKGGVTKGPKRTGTPGMMTVPYLRVANVQRGYLDLAEVLTIDATPKEIADLTLRRGDILLNEGGDRDKLGRGWVWEGQLEPCIHQNHVFRARLVADWIEPKLISMYLNNFGQQYFISEGKQTTNLASISLSKLSGIPVPVIPPWEQHRIVAKIDKLTDRSRRAREALDAIPALLDRFRQSVLATAFRGDLTAEWRAKNPDVEPASVLLERIRQERESNQSPRKVRSSRTRVASDQARRSALDGLPESWQLVPLGEVTKLQPGYAFNSSWYVPEGTRLLRGTNVVPGGTRWTDTVCLPSERAAEFDEYLLADGDVVIAMDRPIISGGLKVAVLTQHDLPALLLQRVGRLKQSKHLLGPYLYYFLNSRFFIDYIGKQATGTQLPHISANDIESVMLPLPPAAEQKVIVEQLVGLLGTTNNVSDAASSGKARLEHLDQSILAQAFRGELVPQDPNDEPASVLLERIRGERTEAVVPKARRGRKPRELAEL